MPVASIPAQQLERLWKAKTRSEILRGLRELTISCTNTAATKYRNNKKARQGFSTCGQIAGALVYTYEQLLNEQLSTAEQESVDMLLVFAKTKLTLDVDMNEIPKEALTKMEHKLATIRASHTQLDVDIASDMASLMSPAVLIATPDPEDKMD